MAGKQHKKPLLWARFIANYPRLLFGIGLSIHILFVAINGILYALNYDILPMVFDDIPLQNNNEPQYVRYQAWFHRNRDLEAIARRKRSIYDPPKNQPHAKVSARTFLEDSLPDFKVTESLLYETIEEKIIHDSNQNENRPKRRKRQTEKTKERSALMETIYLSYDGNGENILTKKRLQAIKAFEDDLFQYEDYQDTFCHLIYTGNVSVCYPFHSILRFFDGSMVYRDERLYDPTFDNIEGVLLAAAENPYLLQELQFFMAKDYILDNDTKTVSSKLTRSVMSFGYPLEGSDIEVVETVESWEDTEDLIKWKNWAFDKLVPYLKETVESGIGENVGFYYFSYPIYYDEAMIQVMHDWVLIIASILFTFTFMWFQTGSLFVTGFGVLSIITSFFGANIIYNCIVGFKFFGIFNILAIFLILGIGADDIFIYMDTWKLYLRQDLDSLALKISQTFRRAAVAMFITSLTTMCAFFVNIASPLLPIMAFGAYAGLTVLVNYISVITFFPAVVTVYHIYFKKYSCCCCCPSNPYEAPNAEQQNGEVRNNEITPQTNGTFDPIMSNGITHKSESTANIIFDDASTSTVPDHHQHLSFPDRVNEKVSNFFGGPFFRFVTHKVIRWIILILFTALVGGAIYVATTLEMQNDEFSIFRPGNHYEVAKNLAVYDYYSDGRSKRMMVTVVFGMQPQDRSSCPVTAFDPDEPCTGETVWDENFDLSDHKSQKALKTFCEKLRYPDPDFAEDMAISTDHDTGVGDTICFILDMMEFYQTEATLQKYPPGTEFSVPWTQEQIETLMKGNPDIYRADSWLEVQNPLQVAVDYWLNNGYATEKIPSEIKKHNTYLGFRPLGGPNLAVEGQPPIYENKIMYVGVGVTTSLVRQRVFLENGLPLLKLWEDWVTSELQKMPEGLQGGFQFGLRFFWVRVLENLTKTSFTAVGISLGLSFVVIFIGTTNIITGLVATALLAAITVCVVAVIPLAGWKFGLLEALNLCLIVGLAVDYVVHLAEGYHMSSYTSRLDRIQDTLQRVGISVLSGAITTLGASFFLLFARIVFFFQFGAFVFCTIGSSMVFALFVFMALYSLIGPQGYTGSFLKCCKKDNSKKESNIKNHKNEEGSDIPQKELPRDNKNKMTDGVSTPNENGVTGQEPSIQTNGIVDSYDNPALDGTEMYF